MDDIIIILKFGMYCKAFHDIVKKFTMICTYFVTGISKQFAYEINTERIHTVL